MPFSAIRPGTDLADHARRLTVRAEVGRLRRTLGAVVATRPYRIADGVDLRVVRPADPGATPLRPLPRPPAAR